VLLLIFDIQSSIAFFQHAHPYPPKFSMSADAEGRLSLLAYPRPVRSSCGSAEARDADRRPLGVLRIATHKRAVGCLVETELVGHVHPPVDCADLLR